MQRAHLQWNKNSCNFLLICWLYQLININTYISRDFELQSRFSSDYFGTLCQRYQLVARRHDFKWTINLRCISVVCLLSLNFLFYANDQVFLQELLSKILWTNKIARFFDQ